VDFGWDYGTFNHIRIRLYKWEPSATARERVANIVVSRGD
jgi:hypothetical protein